MFYKASKQLFLISMIMVCSLSPVQANKTNVIEPVAQAIDWVWAGQRVWFDFVSQDKYQMIAYYDASRQMSVAVREMGDINGAPWIYHKLPSYLGWDAHNKVVAAFDKEGYIHIVGNLHANPLVYFRSTEPYNPRTLTQVNTMVSSAREKRMTYPEFFVDANNTLYFKYRLGTSGQGQWFYNRWDSDSNAWSALHETTILDGEGERGVYPYGPILGPDGYFHLNFVWRENPRASSNHDLSYAKSRDLINWETSTGKKLPLPITLGSSDVLDPIPMHGGLLNRTPMGFDRDNNPVIVYQKYDSKGDTQIFIARLVNKQWQVKQVSTWENSRVNLDKSGALDLPILNNEPPFANAEGELTVVAAFSGVDWEWQLDHKTLEVVSGGPVERPLSKSITKYDLDNGIPQRVVPMRVEQTHPSTEYYLSWEAMQPNRDQARSDIPAPSILRVHRVR